MRPEKKLLLEEIKEDIKNSKAIIVASHKNITPFNSWTLSKMLKDSKSNFKVVKKRIFKRASDECGLKYEYEELKGHIGVLFVKEDALTATKAFMEFKKDNEGLIDVIKGQIEGKIYTSSELELLSKLPDMNGMRAQILNIFETPMSEILGILSNVLTSIPFCLENKKDLTKKEVKS